MSQTTRKSWTRPARWAGFGLVGLLAFGGPLPACGAVEKYGGLVLEFDRDPALTVDSISVAVTTETRVLEPIEYSLKPKDFPATLGVTTSGDDALVRLHIVAFSAGVPVDVRDLKIEHIPRASVKLVHIHFSTACTLLVSVDEDDVATTCSAGKTCDPETASCVSGTLDARDLPSFSDGSDGTGGGPSGTGGGEGSGGGSDGEKLDPACANKEQGDAFCSSGQRYRCGEDRLLSQTTPDPCAPGETCSAASGDALCMGGCAEDNGGCAPGIACVDTAEGPKCSGCDADELSPSGDGTDCIARTDCEAGTFVADPGSATMDRACSPCEEQTFSNSTNAVACEAWQSCPGAFVETSPGSTVMDRVCGDSGIRQVPSGGNDEVYSVARSASGLLCMAGHVDGALPGEQSVGGEDAFVACFDAFGGLIWLDQFGTAKADAVNQVIFDGAENVVVVGVTEGELASEAMGGKDSFVRKYSSAGRVLWTKQWGTRGDDGVYGVALTTDGALITVGASVGSFVGIGAGDQDVSITALSDSGSELWTNLFGSEGGDLGLAVAADDKGGFFVVGSARGRIVSMGNFPGETTFVRRYDPSGSGEWQAAWTDQFGSGANTVGRAIAYDAVRGRLAIGGNTNGMLGQALIRGSVGDDVFVRTYVGTVAEFTVRLGSAAADHGNAIGIDTDHSIWIAADVRGDVGAGYAGGADVLLAQLTEAGALGALQTFGTSANDLVNGLAIAPEGIWLAVDSNGDFEGTDGTSEATAALLYLAQREPI